jgi:hypothetical protein
LFDECSHTSPALFRERLFQHPVQSENPHGRRTRDLGRLSLA